MSLAVSRQRLEDSFASDDDNDGFVEVDLVQCGELLSGRWGLEQTKIVREGWWLVHTPPGCGLVGVVSSPTTTPRWGSDETGTSIRADDDVTVGSLVQGEFILALILVTRD